MDLIGKSPISVPVFITGKAAFGGCSLFFIVKVLYPGAMLFDSALTRAIGLLLYGAGFVIVLVSLLHLGEAAAVGIPERQTRLKTRGLYRFTRNPIYMGAFIMCAGSCLYSIHPVNFLLFAVALLVHLRIVRKEEEFLERRFGQQWLDYKQRVPRYVGLIHRKSTAGPK